MVTFHDTLPWERVLWHVPTKLGFMLDGMDLGGQSLILTRQPGRRKWQCYDRRAQVSPRYVNPNDCEPLGY